jgi:hypothetical protein
MTFNKTNIANTANLANQTTPFRHKFPNSRNSNDVFPSPLPMLAARPSRCGSNSNNKTILGLALPQVLIFTT